MHGRWRLLLVLVVFVAGCDEGPLPTLPEFPESTVIAIDDRQLKVAVADTAAARSRGLMGVTDLGALDGMLFVFEQDTETGFWMKDTLIPLDIAFFDADGVAVERLTMVPCTTHECPLYHAAGPFRYAVEAPAGDLEWVHGGMVLRLDGGS